MDSSAASLLLLFSANFVFLILVVLSFGIVRQIRGDRAKVKLTNTFIQNSEFSDLETFLLDPNKSNSNQNFLIAIKTIYHMTI